MAHHAWDCASCAKKGNVPAGLGKGSGPVPSLKRTDVTPGLPSPKSQVNSRSSLPGSVASAFIVSRVPMDVEKNGARPTVGATFATRTSTSAAPESPPESRTVSVAVYSPSSP